AAADSASFRARGPHHGNPCSRGAPSRLPPSRVMHASEPLHRTRFPWTPVWANEGGRPEGIGDESGEGWPRGGRDGGGGANGRGATRAVECASEGRDRAAALEGRGAGHGVARDAGAGARARA